MKNSTVLLIIGFGLFLILLFRKPLDKGFVMVQKAISRGYRNNNPGNIRLTTKNGKPEMWQGEIPGTDKSFKTFKSMVWGYRAIFITLRSYLKNGHNTILRIINRYAPATENHTQSYINTVVNMTGIPSGKILSFDRPDELLKVVEAISFVENGIKANPDEIKQGYQLFKDTTV